MKDEPAGPLYVGQPVTALKERLTALEEMRDTLNTVDMSDPDHWVLMATGGGATFMAEHGQLPNVAYCLTHMLNSVSNMGKDAPEEIQNQIKMAVMTAMEESKQQEMEVSNENSNSNLPN